MSSTGATSKTITITITDVNEAPAIAPTELKVSVAEDASAPGPWTFTATDPEDDDLTWSLEGDDARSFTMSGGVLTFSETALNFEMDPSYTVTVTVRDDRLSTGAEVTITVTNVEEVGTVAITAGSDGIAGDTFTAILTDPDTINLGTVTWMWSGDGDDNGSTSFTSVYTSVEADDGETLTATATYYDGLGTRTKPGSITVLTATNQDPTISGSASTTIDETATSGSDGHTVGAYTANDPDGDNAELIWSRGGSDSASFSLSETKGASTTLYLTASPLNAISKSSYSATLTVTDERAGTDTISVTVAIRNVDQPGTVLIIAGDDGIAGDTFTATLSDPDSVSLTNVKWQWALDGTDVGTNSASYATVAADGGKTLRATATYFDGAGEGTDRQFDTITVLTATNQVPTISGSDSGTVPENEAAAVGTYTADDPDGSNANLTWTADSTDFSLSPTTGARVTLSSKADSIDFEPGPDTTVPVTITVTDEYGGTDTMTVTVAITDVDELGKIELSPSDGSNLATGNTVTATLTDPDTINLGNITWTWFGDGSFTSANPSVYTVAAADVGTMLSVTARYFDGTGGTADIARNSIGIGAMVDSPGGVTLSRSSVRVDQSVTATLTDDDATAGQLAAAMWQWKRDGTDIFGAMSASYTAITADVGKTLSVTATYTDSRGSAPPVTGIMDNAVLARGTTTVSTGGGTTTTTTTTTTPPTTPQTPDTPTTTGKPDLVVLQLTLSQTSVAPGATITLSVTVRNQGQGDAASSTLTYYRSTNATISTGDSRVSGSTVGALNANTSATESASFNAPTTPGMYYYGACIGGVNGESNTANNCSSGVKLTVSEPPEMPDVSVGVPVYWIERGEASAIRRVESDDTRIDSIVTVGLQKPAELALDVVNRKVYWTDIDAKTIRRANLDGTGAQGVVTAGLNTPNGIALDVTGGQVYWTDWGAKKIQRANFDGTGVQDLVTNSRSLLSGIALDVAGGKMYWVDFGSDTIWRANLDGTEVADLMIAGLSIPFAIALDVAGGKMYWADKGTHKIQSANLDGTGVQDLLTRAQGIDNPNSIALDVASGTMYWTESSEGKGDIKSANLDGSNVQTLFTDRDDPRSIALDIPPSTTVRRTVSTPVTKPPTQQPASKAEDVNDDGVVDVKDILLVVSNLGKTGRNAADVNGDGTVNEADIALVALAMGVGAAAPVASMDALDVVTPERVREWIAQAITSGENQEAILALEQLLSLLTPKQTALLANYPNPFNPEAWIPYQLANDADVQISIYDISGALVRQLHMGHQQAANYTNRSRAGYWDGRNGFGERVVSGIYFYTLTARDFSATRKMLISK